VLSNHPARVGGAGRHDLESNDRHARRSRSDEPQRQPPAANTEVFPLPPGVVAHRFGISGPHRQHPNAKRSPLIGRGEETQHTTNKQGETMNTDDPVHYAMRGNITPDVTAHDCGNVGEPGLFIVRFGGVDFYTRNAKQLLDNFRTAALELARVIAKQRDEERTEND
jgi:hypothetical protein